MRSSVQSTNVNWKPTNVTKTHLASIVPSVTTVRAKSITMAMGLPSAMKSTIAMITDYVDSMLRAKIFIQATNATVNRATLS